MSSKLTVHERLNMYELRKYKKDSKKIAKDFHYGDEVIEKIENAKSVEEISRILRTARRKML